MIVPVVAPLGTVIWESEITVNVIAVPCRSSAVARVKLEPYMVTVVPTSPLHGENEVIAGAVEAIGENSAARTWDPPELEV